MNYQEIPQFSEESLEELTQILVEFFLKRLSEEALSNIEVEIRFKQSPQESQAILQEPQTIAKGRCLEGEGAGCGPGFRWKIERST